MVFLVLINTQIANYKEISLGILLLILYIETVILLVHFKKTVLVPFSSRPFLNSLTKSENDISNLHLITKNISQNSNKSHLVDDESNTANLISAAQMKSHSSIQD